MTAETTKHPGISQNIGPRPDDSKEALLWAAKQLFAQYGIDGTTVKQLADLAEVNVSMVSYYFGGKDGLFKAIIEQFGNSRLEVVERMLKPASSLEEFRVKLTLFTEDFFLFHLANSEVTTIIHRECTSGNHVAEESFRNVFMKMSKSLQTFIQSGVDSGYLRETPNTLITTGLYFGSLIHMVNSSPLSEKFFNLSLNDPKHRETVIQQAVQNFLEGVVNRA